jgi:hypothetical protein
MPISLIMSELALCLLSVNILISLRAISILFRLRIKKIKKLVVRKIFVYRYPNYHHQSDAP